MPDIKNFRAEASKDTGLSTLQDVLDDPLTCVAGGILARSDSAHVIITHAAGLAQGMSAQEVIPNGALASQSFDVGSAISAAALGLQDVVVAPSLAATETKPASVRLSGQIVTTHGITEARTRLSTDLEAASAASIKPDSIKPDSAAFEAALRDQYADLSGMGGYLGKFHEPPLRNVLEQLSVRPLVPAKAMRASEARVGLSAGSIARVQITSVADIGKRVRTARKAMGMTQQRFADLAGVGRRFLIELEHGKPSLEIGRVLAVCQAAGVKFGFLS